MRVQRFGELRRLLRQPPSEASWAELCAHLAAWTFDERFHEAVLPYVREELVRWPEHLKIAPRSWAEPLLRVVRKPAPLLSLVAALDLTQGGIGDRTLSYLLRGPEIEHLTQLDLSCNEISADGASLLAASPYVRNLKVLLLAGTNLKDEGAREIAHSANLANLDELDLTDSQLLGEGCRMIENSPHLCQTIRERAFDWYDERHPYDSFWE